MQEIIVKRNTIKMISVVLNKNKILEIIYIIYIIQILMYAFNYLKNIFR